MARLSKAQIVGEAMDLIEQDGVAALSMRKLAVRLDVKAAALYYHVPDKGALLNDLLIVLLERCFDVMNDTATWQQWMSEFGRAIWTVQREMPSTPLLILNTKLDEEHFDRSVELIRDALAGFEGDQDEMMVIQSAVQAVVTGWSIFAQSAYAERMGQMLDFEKLAMRSVDSLVRGWGNP